MDQESCVSVQCERPGPSREFTQDTLIALWAAMAIAGLILIAIGWWNWRRNGAKCSTCEAPILLRDHEARLCQECGGLNRRID